MQSAELRLSGLTKRYGRAVAVKDVSLRIEPGSLVALLGPSGCGKTTCLRMMAGLVQPSDGDIFLDGKRVTDIPVHRRNVGMLFQNYALFPHMTVAQNVAFGLEMRHVNRSDAARRVASAMALVRLSEFGARYPAQLSGGQQQRVALARALVIEPAILLLDEPLGALDKGLRENMQIELRALQRSLGVTTIIVTHDQDEAITMADSVVVMRDGRLEQVGSATEIYRKPVSRFVATFLGASNLFEGQVQSRDGRQISVRTATGLQLTADCAMSAIGSVTVSVRPEAIMLEAADALGTLPTTANSVGAEIEQVIYRGSMTHYHLRLADGVQIIAYQQNRAHGGIVLHEVGARVIAHWDASDNHVLTAD